ncbi:MAG: HAMP domain-containing histidine kinase, partial [Clostridia bacterium]|nr:HAMP domain-containing histidine kinase [Clostridia bacterium]
IILLVTVLVFSGIEILLERTRIMEVTYGRLVVVIICAAASITLGSFITAVSIRLPMLPIKKLMRGLTRLANGHFEERIEFREMSAIKELADAFNTLAEELQNTEMLRSDFVNNFSHEFKTPIVSIRGFARMLQRPDLPPEKRREYADIIVEESNRLANMATNVLKLTKIEKQTILTNKQEFNLSEQLRRCILLLADKWEAKQLDMQADFPEYLIRGDMELLNEVWFNLLDNAVKFSPAGGTVEAHIVSQDGWLRVSIHNHGPQITPEQQKRLFDRFWQGDASRSAEGTGIGLSIVKKVVELHGGQVSVQSSPEETVFTVSLPQA